MDHKVNPQNLISQVNPRAESIQPRFYKALVFDILTVGAAALLGYLYNGYLNGVFPFGHLLGALAVFAVFSTLQVFFMKDLGRRFFILLLEAAALLFFFFLAGYGFALLGAAALVMVILFFWGEVAGKMELNNALEVRFFRAARPFLQKFTTAMVVVFIILYVPFWSPEKVFVAEGTFQNFIDWFSNVVGGFYPEIRLNATFLEFTRGLARNQLSGDPAFANLAAAAQEEILNRTAAQVAANLSKSLGAEIKPEDSVGATFYEVIVNLLRDWHARFGNLFLATWAIAIFFVLRGFGAIFYWFTGILSFIIYQILLASGFAHIIGETRTHEVIDW